MSEAALKQLQSIVRAQEAPDFTRGTEAYEDELRVHKKRAGLVAGVGQVDRLMAGIGGCVEISGPDGLGKTVRVRLSTSRGWTSIADISFTNSCWHCISRSITCCRLRSLESSGLIRRGRSRQSEPWRS